MKEMTRHVVEEYTCHAYALHSIALRCISLHESLFFLLCTRFHTGRRICSRKFLKLLYEPMHRPEYPARHSYVHINEPFYAPPKSKLDAHQNEEVQIAFR